MSPVLFRSRLFFLINLMEVIVKDKLDVVEGLPLEQSKQ